MRAQQLSDVVRARCCDSTPAQMLCDEYAVMALAVRKASGVV